MNMRSSVPCLSSLVFVAGLVAATDKPDVGTPEGLIRSLYARHQPGKEKNLEIGATEKPISKYCDRRLTDLFIRDCECARRSGEFCQLDSDPFYDAQDFDGSDPNPRVKPIASNSFEVTLHNFGDTKLIYKMKKTSDGWRVIESPTNKSLIKLLSVNPK